MSLSVMDGQSPFPAAGALSATCAAVQPPGLSLQVMLTGLDLERKLSVLVLRVEAVIDDLTRRIRMIIETPRTRLRCWELVDRDGFAAMLADPEVMHDYGGPISRRESDAKLDRYSATYSRYGFCRWAVETPDGSFLGYAGVMPSPPGHPLGSHFEIGWRLVRRAWGHGYATEAARAALSDAFTRIGLTEVLAYTAIDNLRSQAVMARLHLRRDTSRDFTADYDTIKGWQGLVWVASPGQYS